MCRLHSREISTLKPVLQQAGINIAAVGVEELGAEAFVQGNYFDGDVYYDATKQIYKDLKYGSSGFCGFMMSLCNGSLISAVDEAKRKGVDHYNLKGEKWQHGGILAVKPGGEVMIDYKQTDTLITMENAEILAALGIDGPVPTLDEPGTNLAPVCDGDVCAMPAKKSE